MATGVKAARLGAMRFQGKRLLPTLVLVSLAAVPVPCLAGKAGEVRTGAFQALNEGVSAYKRGDYAKAIERLQASSSVALNSFRAYYYLGLALIGDRRYAEAVEPLTIALDLSPTHLQAHVALGDAHLKLGDLTEGNASYFRALKLRAEFAAALDGLARIYEAKSDDLQAVEHYKRAIDSDRAYAPAYTHLGDLYLRSDRFEDAVELLEEAVDVRPDFAAGLNRLALAYGRLGLQNEAVATVQRALELQPRDASHPATLGWLQLREGFMTAAERWFVRSLELDPNTPEARTGLAEVARRRGRYSLALGQVDLAMSDARLDAAQRGRLEELRESLVDEERSFAELRDRVSTDAAGADTYAELAAIYARRGEWERAVELQERAGDDPRQRERLAYMLFQAGRYRDAQALYAELASVAPSAELEINTGVTAALLGDEPGAMKAYERALARDPGNRRARLYLANAQLRAGQQDRAVDTYAEYLADGARGEAAERVRRILERIAPDRVPERPPAALATPVQPVQPVAPADDTERNGGAS